VETASHWQLKNQEGTTLSEGFNLFRKATKKDATDKKLISVLKFKHRRGDESTYYVNEEVVEDGSKHEKFLIDMRA